jgi:hypothetical protein
VETLIAKTPPLLTLQDGGYGVIITSAQQASQRLETVRCLDAPSHGALRHKSNLKADWSGGGMRDYCLTTASCGGGYCELEAFRETKLLLLLLLLLL